MKTPTYTFETLKLAKLFIGKISLQGFLLNVANSFKEGKITKQEKEELLLNINI